MKTVYDFKVLDKKGHEVSLSEYKGKVLLIVNTASKCGFTPQYEELEAMYERLNDKGCVETVSFRVYMLLVETVVRRSSPFFMPRHDELVVI